MNPQTGEVREFTSKEEAILHGFTRAITKDEFEAARMEKSRAIAGIAALAVAGSGLATDVGTKPFPDEPVDRVGGFGRGHHGRPTFMPSPKSRFKQRPVKSR